EGEGAGPRRSAADHRRRRREPRAVVAQPAERAGAGSAARRPGHAGELEERARHAQGGGEAGGDVLMSFTQERLLTVLLAPVVSEKSTFVGERANQYVFRVATDATKPEIKAAVELLFSTKDKKLE